MGNPSSSQPATPEFSSLGTGRKSPALREIHFVMSQPALSEAEDRLSGSRVSPRRAAATSAGKRSRTPSAAAPSHVPERLFRWRVLGGLLFMLLFTPFLGVSLAAPAFTGEAGTGVANFLYFWLGRAAWMLPVLTLTMAMILFESDPIRELHLRWAVPVLFLDVIVLAARMGGQGGEIGAALDGALVHAVGPMGSWLLSLSGFLAGLVLLWQVTLEELLLGLSVLGRMLERIVLALAGLAAGAFRAMGRGLAAVFRSGVAAARRPRAETAPVTRRMVLDEPAEEAPSRPTRNGRGRKQAEVPFFPESDEVPAPPAAAEASEPSLEEPSLDPGPPSEDPPEESFEEIDATAPWESMDEVVDVPHASEPSVEATAVDVAPVPTATAVAPPKEAAKPATLFPSDEGLLEEPGGQLRLFALPTAAAAAPMRYRLPPLSLLDDGPRVRRTKPVEDKSKILVDTLESFGVQARVVNVVQGPTVSRYELQPARGVKVSKFTALTNDIALALAAVSVRIEAPIPGKAAIGIEVPNLNTELVVLKDILSSEGFRKGTGLCLGLGKDITGQAQMADLQKMPHLLVAGTTGSGKSVCVNTLILSLVYRFTPRRLQLLMIDPKQVELSIYEGLPHLVGLSGEDTGRIIVDPKKAAMALKQVVDLMEDRYTQFARCRVRNLKEYNDQAEEPLPWMVVIIDELADLMMVASKTVETSICRLAQKARAAGIHIVVATQRPSTDVITGLIKVNIPSRIAFAVSSGVDSRVILDTGGAENLLGKGDMLFLPVDASEPRRIQGAYVTNEEIQRVVEFWREQAAPENRIELAVHEADADDVAAEADDDGSDDDLVQEALQVVLRYQQASASMLQTELKVGYARARRILTMLERKGYVGPAEGSKPRKILYQGGDM